MKILHSTSLVFILGSFIWILWVYMLLNVSDSLSQIPSVSRLSAMTNECAPENIYYKTLQDYSDFTHFIKYQLLVTLWPKLKLREKMLGSLIQISPKNGQFV